MKIAYGIMGEGRGHAARLLTIGPRLQAELLIFAGGDAYDFLTRIDLSGFVQKVEIVKIPTFGFRYSGAKISFFKTLIANIPKYFDIKLHNTLFKKWGLFEKNTQFVEDRINLFQPNLIISDGEPYISHIKRKVQFISLDRFAKIAFCESSISSPISYRIKKALEVWTYKQLLAKPAYIITTSFYEVAPKKKMEKLMFAVGPIFREEVVAAKPSQGNHVVVYATNAYVYTKPFFKTLQNLSRKIYCYGSSQKGIRGNIEFCEFDTNQFTEHLTSCAYVISTAGNMLLSELRYLKKRALLFKTASLEQQENILYASKIGFARQIEFTRALSEKEVEKHLLYLHASDSTKDNSDLIVEKILSFLK